MRNSIKFIANCIFFIPALFVFIYYKFESFFIGRKRSFPGISESLSLLPGLIGVYTRRWFYTMSLRKGSVDSNIGFGTVFSHPDCEMGKHVYIGTHCTIGKVSFGDYATIGSNVDIMNRGKQHYTNDIDVPVQEQGGEYPRVFIGEDTWIGNSSVILADVGKKSIVGAGSVVAKDVEEHVVVAGNPATVIKKRM